MGREDGTNLSMSREGGTNYSLSREDGKTFSMSREDGTTYSMSMEDGTDFSMSKEDVSVGVGRIKHISIGRIGKISVCVGNFTMSREDLRYGESSRQGRVYPIRRYQLCVSRRLLHPAKVQPNLGWYTLSKVSTSHEVCNLSTETWGVSALSLSPSPQPSSTESLEASSSFLSSFW